MTAWTDPDRAIVARYLGKLRLRSANSRIYYRQVLHGFQDVAERHLAINRQTLEEAPGKRSALASIDRFAPCPHRRSLPRPSGRIGVDHQQSHFGVVLGVQHHAEPADLAGVDVTNAGSGACRTAPAQAVRQRSGRDHARAYRANAQQGISLRTQAAWFLRFDRFLQVHPELASEPVTTMLDRWVAAKTTRHHVAECEKLKQALTKALRHLDPSVPGRRPDARPQKEAAKHHRKPHIYSPADVQRILQIARSYPSPRAPLRPRSLHAMLLLAYCAGLRRSELARLDLGDIDLRCGTITVRETKFFKTRILPLPDTVMAELRTYIDARRSAGAPQDPQSGLFWHDRGNDRYTSAAIAWLLVDVIRRAELKPPSGRTGPRVHDLRHSMVVNRILQWYRSGINPQDRLPFLATYLGHRDITSTLVYITVTQELLQEASERFRVIGARCLDPAQEAAP